MGRAWLTQRDQVAPGLQSHVAVQSPLGQIQLSPLLLREGHSHVLEAHRWLKHHLCYHGTLLPQCGCWVRGMGSTGRERMRAQDDIYEPSWGSHLWDQIQTQACGVLTSL